MNASSNSPLTDAQGNILKDGEHMVDGKPIIVKNHFGGGNGAANKTVIENGLIDDQDFADFRKRSVDSKFKTALYGGFGNAAIFGLFAGLSGSLIPALTALSAISMVGAIVTGIVAVSALSAAGIYFISRANEEMFRSTVLDQDFQAKKIACYTGHNQEPAATVEYTPQRSDGKKWEQAILEQRAITPEAGQRVHGI